MLSQRLKKLRELRKMTQKSLADILSVGTSTVAMWETGGRHPDYEMLIRIADLFEVSVDSLLGRTDFSSKVDTESERIKYLSDIEILKDEVMQTFDQALSDGAITEEQAKISLQLFKQNILLITDSNQNN